MALEPDQPHCFLSSGEDGAVISFDMRSKKSVKLLVCKTQARHANAMVRHPVLPTNYRNMSQHDWSHATKVLSYRLAVNAHMLLLVMRCTLSHSLSRALSGCLGFPADLHGSPNSA